MIRYCPIHQCGGELKTVDDDQVPDLKCNNCGAIYRCINIEEL